MSRAVRAQAVKAAAQVGPGTEGTSPRASHHRRHRRLGLRVAGSADYQLREWH